MKKILVLSATSKLHLEDHGGKQRTMGMLKHLSKNYEIIVLSLSWEGDTSTTDVNNNLRIISIPVEQNVLRAAKKEASKFINGNSDVLINQLHKFMQEYKKRVYETSKNFDLVIIDQYAIAPFARYINPKVPTVYSSHNCETDLAINMYGKDSFDAQVVRSMEEKAISMSAALSYCSKEDLEKINEHFGYDLHTYYVPNGTEVYKKTSSENFNSKNILFVGSGHPPNTEAAYKIIDLAESCPEFNFIIAGSVGPSLYKEKFPSNVQITGYLDNKEIESLFGSAFAFINPMAVGSGSHLKMTMAMGHALPIITTPVGARGFDDEEQKQSMIIINDQNDMIAAIKKIQDQSIYEKLSAGSLELAKKYSWENSAKELLRMVSENVRDDRPQPAEVQIKKNTAHKKEKILLYSIIRNEAKFMDGYYNKLKSMVKSFPEYEFYLSIYENDSSDGTKLKIFTKDWSFFKGISIISEDIQTLDYGSVKDADRVRNLSTARNKAIEAAGFLEFVDYIFMVESDMEWDNSAVEKILSFKNYEPDFDIVSGITIRGRKLYDAWATRKTPHFVPNKPVLSPNYKTKRYDKYYSTSNGLCLYRAEPFRQGVRYGWINTVTGEPDCDTVVVCQNFHEKGYSNIFIIHNAEIYHEHR